MKKTSVVLCLVVAMVGCKKKEAPAPAPGSAAPAPAAAPGSAAAPAPAAGGNGIKVSANFEQYNGVYGVGVFKKNFDGYLALAFAKDCPSFGCEHWSSVNTMEDAFKTACPTGRVLKVEFKNPKEMKVGANEAYLDLSEVGGGTTMTARHSTAKVDITKIGDDVVTGTIDFGTDSPDDTMAKGSFTAKACPPTKE